MATAQDTTVGPGIFITFEGGDGAGKTTHITFLAECLRKMGHEVLCLREPGGTAIGEALRSIVLNPENSAMSDQAELLIYEAARAQIVKETIIPALARGAVVLLDRFYDSTVAYQAYGRGLLCTRPMCSPAKGCIPVAPSCSPPKLPLKKGLNELPITEMPTGLSRQAPISMHV